MSGPKISVYELSGWGKKIVFGQMRCEQQSVLCAQQIQELIHQTLSYSGEFQKQMSLLEILLIMLTSLKWIALLIFCLHPWKERMFVPKTAC